MGTMQCNAMNIMEAGSMTNASISGLFYKNINTRLK